MIVGTAGHIDHGKTALVRALTGIDTDRLPEEQRRGITIDLGFAPLDVEGVGVAGVVDVPGHEAFVRTMVAGATGVDVALLVIAADEGVMPQTREHVAILQLLGVTRAVVALTKCDLVDDDFRALAADDAREALRDTPFADAPVLAVSARTGAGIDALRAALGEALRAAAPRSDEDLTRLPIDRAFTVRGTGTVVTGTLWSGRVTRDSALTLYPGGRTVRVRGIHQHGHTVDEARAGMRVALALAGVEVAELQRGAVLVAGHGWAESTLLRADVRLLTSALHLSPRSRLQFHLGTREVSARVLVPGADANTGASTMPARVALSEPVVARAGDRFVLRAPAPLGTVGGGIVADPRAPRRARPWPIEAPPARRLELLLAEAGISGVELAGLPVRLGISPREVETLVESLAAVTRVGDRIWPSPVVESTAEAVFREVEEHHARFPLEPAVPVNRLRTVSAMSANLTGHIFASLIGAGRLQQAEGGVARPGWAPGLDGDSGAIADGIRRRLADAKLEAPTAAELAAELGADPVPVLRFLERSGEVTQVAEGWWFLKRSVAELVELLRVELERDREYAPAELRERLGLSRKYLIPILEYCDRAGVTVRRGNNRVLRG